MCQTPNVDEAPRTSTLLAAKDRTRPLFSLGRIVATPGVITLFEEHDINPFEYLDQHIRGLWGDELPPEDWKSNDEALIHGWRLFSAYVVKETKIWVISDWDRSVTTLLLPAEY